MLNIDVYFLSFFLGQEQIVRFDLFSEFFGMSS